MASTDALRVELEIGGEALLVVRCDVEEGVSVLGGATAVVGAPEDDLEARGLVDQRATLTMTPAVGEPRSFSFRVAGVRYVEHDEGLARYAIELRPAFWFLRFGKNVRKWRDQTTETIVSAVLAENGVAHTWRTTRPCALRPWTVQYRETHLDFVRRLLEFEGIWFTFEADGTMVLADLSPAAPAIDGTSIVQLLDAEGALVEGARGITSIARGARIGTGKSTVNDHDMKKPTTSLLQSATGGTQTDLEVYDYPTGYRDPAVGALLAQLRLQAFECRKVYVRGHASLLAMQSGRTFELQQREAMTFGDGWFVTRVEHAFVDARAGVAATYTNRFEAIPSGTPFRPALETPRPIVDGNHTAMVRGPAGEEIHTDTMGRAKVQFHWDREATGTDADSRWVRVLQETSSSIALARVGWEVLVAYVDGDPDRPVAITRNINGEMRPTYEQPAKKNVMTIKTETYPGKGGFNELKLDDSAGAMMMAIKAERMLANNVQHDKTETIGRNETHVVLNGLSRNIDKTQTVVIGANERIQVTETAKLSVNEDRAKTVGGSETVKVGGSTSVSVTGNDTETVGGVRRTFSGSINLKIPTPKDLLKSLVPTPSQAAAALGTAALGAQAGGALGQLAGGASPSTVARGLADGAVKSFLAGGNGLGSETRAKTPGGGGSGGGPGGGAESGGGGPGGAGPGGALGALGGLGAPGGGAAMASSLQSAAQSLVPSASSVLSKATGGLSDVRSFSDLAQFLSGSISRSAGQRTTRSVGGAYLALAGGNISHDGQRVLAEVAGGIKLTVSAKENVAQTVTGQLGRVVGGIQKWTAKGDVNVSAETSTVRVGMNATFESGDKLEMQSEEIEIEAKTGLKLEQGGLLFELTPDGITLKGNVKLDAGDKVKVVGGPDDLTAG